MKTKRKCNLIKGISRRLKYWCHKLGHKQRKTIAILLLLILAVLTLVSFWQEGGVNEQMLPVNYRGIILPNF